MNKNKYTTERLDENSLLCMYPSIESADRDFEERTKLGQRIIDAYFYNDREFITWECPEEK